MHLPAHEMDTAPPFVGPDGRIKIDLPCSCCGYNLRDMEGAGSCPECGKATLRAIAAERARRHEDVNGPAGYRRLCFGMVWGALLAPIANTLTMVASRTGLLPINNWSMVMLFTLFWLVVGGMTLLMSLLCIWNRQGRPLLPLLGLVLMESVIALHLNGYFVGPIP